jgi:hypothetical protein
MGKPTITEGVWCCEKMHTYRPPPDAAVRLPRKIVLKPGQKEFKVVTQADQWFMGKFDPERLTTYINELSSEGWDVVAVCTADRATWFGSFGGTTRQEIVVFLKRVVQEETTMHPHEEKLGDLL